MHSNLHILTASHSHWKSCLIEPFCKLLFVWRRWRQKTQSPYLQIPKGQQKALKLALLILMIQQCRSNIKNINKLYLLIIITSKQATELALESWEKTTKSLFQYFFFISPLGRNALLLLTSCCKEEARYTILLTYKWKRKYKIQQYFSFCKSSHALITEWWRLDGTSGELLSNSVFCSLNWSNFLKDTLVTFKAAVIFFPFNKAPRREKSN